MRLATVASLVKFEHTVFALPFAYVGMLWALEAEGRGVTVSVVVWITLAMVGARTLAMALNRLVDRRIDAANPRTAMRELPAGRMTMRAVVVVCGASLVLLLLATTQLHPLTRWLWPVPVVLFFLYPYTKRFTWLCHLVLGATVGLAPVGASIAVRGDVSTSVLLLWAASATWVAGFDVIYATQDVDVDRVQGLHSIPARFGIARALGATRALHLATAGGLGAAGGAAGAGTAYWIGTAAAFGLLTTENAIVKPDDLSRVNAAFFTTNGVIGIVFALGVAIDHAVGA